MSDPRNVIQGMFATSSRYGIFGDVIVQIHIQGVRCHQNTVIDVESPIVALCGLNGTGKSTALQLAAVAYQNDSEVYYVKDFMVEGPLDPSPFSENTSRAAPRIRSRAVRTPARARRGRGRRAEARIFGGRVDIRDSLETLRLKGTLTFARRHSE